MKSTLMTTLGAFALLALMVPTSASAKGPLRASAAIWSHGELYGTVGTPTEFRDPPEGTTDTLYNFQMSGLMGQRAISEAAPGDRDFNGGRWSVVRAIFTDLGMMVHDPDGDGEVNFELTSAEEVLDHVDLGHIILEHADFYFECPMLPGRNQQ
jgi:hypothetical protein